MSYGVLEYVLLVCTVQMLLPCSILLFLWFPALQLPHSTCTRPTTFPPNVAVRSDMVHCKEVIVPLFTGEIRGFSLVVPQLCTRVYASHMCAPLKPDPNHNNEVRTGSVGHVTCYTQTME